MGVKISILKPRPIVQVVHQQPRDMQQVGFVVAIETQKSRGTLQVGLGFDARFIRCAERVETLLETVPHIQNFTDGRDLGGFSTFNCSPEYLQSTAQISSSMTALRMKSKSKSRFSPGFASSQSMAICSFSAVVNVISILISAGVIRRTRMDKHNAAELRADESRAMIRIAITPAACEAIAATLRLGSVSYEPQLDAKGQRLIWLAKFLLSFCV